MKKFLLRSFIFLGVAILVTIAVFVYLNVISVAPSIATPQAQNSPVVPTMEITTSTPRETLLPSIIPPEGFPLRMLPLSDTQKSVLTAAGIDIETFMITPSMITCGEGKIGKDRMFAISEGDAPSVVEVTKLLPCLRK